MFHTRFNQLPINDKTELLFDAPLSDVCKRIDEHVLHCTQYNAMQNPNCIL